jgi:hypothetical protein
MTRTLIDTDILSDFLRGKNAQVLARSDTYLRQHARLVTEGYARIVGCAAGAVVVVRAPTAPGLHAGARRAEARSVAEFAPPFVGEVNCGTAVCAVERTGDRVGLHACENAEPPQPSFAVSSTSTGFARR